MRFDAFISYRRADGSAVAQRLRHALRDYHLPKPLRTDDRRLSIYLDTIFERADDDFFEKTIKPALTESQYLIVLLTPGVLEQREGGNWVIREIEYFRKLPQGRNVLFATAWDEWTTAVPPEPGASPNAEVVDLRGYRRFHLDRRHGRPARDEVLKLVATLFDVPPERMPELREEDARQRLSRARRLSAVLGLIIVAMALLLVYAIRQRNAFRRELATGDVMNARMSADNGDAAAFARISLSRMWNGPFVPSKGSACAFGPSFIGLSAGCEHTCSCVCSPTTSNGTCVPPWLRCSSMMRSFPPYATHAPLSIQPNPRRRDNAKRPYASTQLACLSTASKRCLQPSPHAVVTSAASIANPSPSPNSPTPPHSSSKPFSCSTLFPGSGNQPRPDLTCL